MGVKLRNNIGEEHYTQRGLWYDQAGALCFFFLHKKGAEGRARFVEYVRNYYLGRARASGWLSLGYDAPEDLDKEFLGWLKGLHGE